MSTKLRYQHNTSNLFYLRVIGRTDAIQIASYLTSQIRNGNKLFKHIFGQNVSEPGLFDIIWAHVNVVGSQMQIGGWYSANTPLSLGRKSGRLIVARRGGDYLIAMLMSRISDCVNEATFALFFLP